MTFPSEPGPRVIAIVVFRRGRDELLLSEGYDPERGLRYLRPLGGGIKFGELSKDAARREIREELGAEMSDLRLIEVMEDVFTNEGKLGHQVAFVYEGIFADASLLNREAWHAREANGEELKVGWYPVGSLEAEMILVPAGLDRLLGLEVRRGGGG